MRRAPVRGIRRSWPAVCCLLPFVLALPLACGGRKSPPSGHETGAAARADSRHATEGPATATVSPPDTIHRDPVKSSTIASIGYDRNSRILEIEFQSGVITQFLDVPENVYAALRASNPPERYLTDGIIATGYVHRTIR